MQLRITF